MKKVQYEEMLPHELEQALREFPVAYVPVGSLEFHGLHLPLGNDSLKVHGIAIRAARKVGGVVVPPTYWGHMGCWQEGSHPGLSPDLVDRLYTEIFAGLIRVGFRVVIGITGHDVKYQLASLQKAADFVTSQVNQLMSPHGGTVGFAMMEGALNADDPDVGMDHGAKWETSALMALRPELVEMDRCKTSAARKIKSGRDLFWKLGIGGEDPRIHASKKVGEKAVDKMADAIGRKAKELLASVTWDENR